MRSGSASGWSDESRLEGGGGLFRGLDRDDRGVVSSGADGGGGRGSGNVYFRADFRAGPAGGGAGAGSGFVLVLEGWSEAVFFSIGAVAGAIIAVSNVGKLTKEGIVNLYNYAKAKRMKNEKVEAMISSFYFFVFHAFSLCVIIM